MKRLLLRTTPILIFIPLATGLPFAALLINVPIAAERMKPARLAEEGHYRPILEWSFGDKRPTREPTRANKKQEQERSTHGETKTRKRPATLKARWVH